QLMEGPTMSVALADPPAGGGADRSDGQSLTAVNDRLSRHEAYWVRRLARLRQVELPFANRASASPTPSGPTGGVEWRPPAGPVDQTVAAFALFLARLAGRRTFDLGFSHPDLRQEIAGLERFFATVVPLRVDLAKAGSVPEAVQALRQELAGA